MIGIFLKNLFIQLKVTSEHIKYIKLLLHKKAAITRTAAFIKNDIDMCVGYIFSTINSLRLFF